MLENDDIGTINCFQERKRSVSNWLFFFFLVSSIEFHKKHSDIFFKTTYKTYGGEK